MAGLLGTWPAGWEKEVDRSVNIQPETKVLGRAGERQSRFAGGMGAEQAQRPFGQPFERGQ
ncbi:MAG TPA: hypothetical protein VHX44_01130, partial [Planctomycetota bacterium]|nr:hypothetical protein [Planctomycetota bacterium]